MAVWSVALAGTVRVVRASEVISATLEKDLALILRLTAAVEEAHVTFEAYLQRFEQPGFGRLSMREQWDEVQKSRKETDAAFLAATDSNLARGRTRRFFNAARAHWRQASLVIAKADPGGPYRLRPGRLRILAAAFNTHSGEITANLRRIRFQVIKDLLFAVNRLDAARRLAIVTTGIAAGVGASLLVVSILILSGSILKPLSEIEEAAGQIGGDDLSIRVPVRGRDELGRLALAFNSMADELSARERNLKNMAMLDSLTGILNSREFYARLEAEVQRARRYKRACSLVMIDVDFLKRINDTHGHQSGDAALRKVADLAADQSRPSDIVARYGGDEFVIIMPETNGQAALAAADRLVRQSAAWPFPSGVEPSHLSISAGVAAFPAHADSAGELVRAADQALYRAKRGGRGRAVLYSRGDQSTAAGAA